MDGCGMSAYVDALLNDAADRAEAREAATQALDRWHNRRWV